MRIGAVTKLARGGTARVAFLLCLLLTVSASSLLHAQAYTSIIVFGDSLSDTGNFAHVASSTFAVQYPGPLFNYTAGRFTDGTDTVPAARNYTGVWVEQLAAGLTATPQVKDSLDGGTDHAYGEATNASGTTTVPITGGLSITVENIGMQIADYAATKPAITSKTLFVVWGGSNDLLTATSQAAITAAVNSAMANIQALINLGATDFIIPNIPPLGSTPNLNTNPTNAAAGTAAAVAYNSGIAAALAALPAANTGKTLHLFQLDIFNLFASIIGNPTLASLANVTASAQGTTVNPDTYLFWDSLHPTTAGHHLIAVAAKNTLTATTPTVTTVTTAAMGVAGQTITLKATVAATGAIPTGTVSFFAGTNPIAVAAAALDVTGAASTSVVVGPVSGSPYTYTARYTGDAANLGSVSAAASVSVVTAFGTTTTLAASVTPVSVGASVTFTATVASPGGNPTGTVTFLDGTSTLGTGTLTAGTASSTATYTTSSLTSGTHSITASYTGAGNFTSSTSAALTETVVVPAVTVLSTPSSLTITSGASNTSNLTFAAVGGITGTYNLSCSSLPSHISCSFAPASITFTASATSQTSVLTIATNSAALDIPTRPGSIARTLPTLAMLPFLGGLAFFGLRRRRIAPRLLVLILALSTTALFGLSGCSTSSSNHNTATGTYQVQVIATPAAGGTPFTSTIPVTVQ